MARAGTPTTRKVDLSALPDEGRCRPASFWLNPYVRASSGRLQHRDDNGKCDGDGRGRSVSHTVSCPQVGGDGTNRQQREPDRCGHPDGRPDQTRQHSHDTGEFEPADGFP